MEALAAVGLAGNIVQFVDFTYKLFNEAASIHSSQSGLRKGAQDLEVVSQDLKSLCTKLSRNEGVHLPTRNTAPQSALENLARNCLHTAEELLSVIARLKVNRNSRWSSFRAALASISKTSEVEALEKTLDGYRMQMILQLQAMQSDSTSTIFDLLDRLTRQSEQVSVDLTGQISSLKEDVQQTLVALERGLERRNDLIVSPTQSRDETMESISPIDASALGRSLANCEKYGTKIMAYLAVLDSLTFDQMDFRHSSIHKAHERTYEGVFENKIVKWLRSRDLLYWVSGKPGSGKSTLMKYIVGNVHTPAHLRHAIKGQEPIIASYFFWVNGTPLQRSQEGLLQSLLYEIFRQSPESIELALPKTWMSFNTTIRRGQSDRYMWKLSELLAVFHRLVSSAVTAARLCVFIDGLDEYGGDHDDLVDTIRCLNDMQIKICVASRPWNVFAEAYGQTLKRKLYMQDVNRPDIELYVKDKLRDRILGQNALDRTSDAETIMDEIAEKSQGVFLWVFLVVRSLKEGLRNHDRLSQLRARLDAFPNDLEAFFDHIFRSIDQNYRVQVAHMFQVALSSSQPLSPLVYWFQDEQEDDPGMAFNMPLERITDVQFDTRVEQTRIRITGRGKGLLEVNPSNSSTLNPSKGSKEAFFESRVDFLHRTVKDFLMTTNIRDTFVAWQQRDFDASLAICQSSLAVLKCSGGGEQIATTRMSIAVQSIMESAKALELKGETSHIPIMRELERLSQLRSFVSLFGAANEDILVVAVQSDLLNFVHDRLRTSLPPTTNSKLRLLISAQTPEMARIVLACEPPLILDFATQSYLVQKLKREGGHWIVNLNGPREGAAILKEIVKHVYFTTDRNGCVDKSLRTMCKDFGIPDPALMSNNRQRQKEYAKALEAFEKQAEETHTTETNHTATAINNKGFRTRWIKRIFRL
ncbi:hypothetical protein BCR34DRAFT_602241 [Clohesyomyces aquaticus]|uniref:NACHT domain-containing protein n=1 Tax=Clohesyomyces aquaticus TaxID=1231657 RepID=A0A1Y1ZJ37_9PLEO|nr:hypothetical protein BCR34DRAFT_602241 [Clohesyomyces aquaticus]